jgi:hypothetical protein
MRALTWKRAFPGRWPGDFVSCETQTMGTKPASVFKIGTGKHKTLPLEKKKTARTRPEEEDIVQLIRRPEDRIARIGHKTRAVVARASDPMQRNRKTCEGVGEGGRARRPWGKR